MPGVASLKSEVAVNTERENWVNVRGRNLFNSLPASVRGLLDHTVERLENSRDTYINKMYLIR